MADAFIVSAVRTPVGKAPNGALRYTRPDEMAAVVIKEALARVPGARRRGDRGRHPGLRHAGGRAGTQRRADREPARGHPDHRVGGHRQPLLLVGPSGDRLRGRAHHDRRRARHRRRRHRVDEHGADGRQQDRAEPGAGRQLPRRLPDHRAGRREPRPRLRHLARGAGRLRLRSHQRAIAAIDAGRFRDETVALPLAGGQTFAVDEGPRRETSIEALAKLRPAFHATGHRHGRQFVADERWRVGGRGHERRAHAGARDRRRSGGSSATPRRASSPSSSASGRCRRCERC